MIRTHTVRAHPAEYSAEHTVHSYTQSIDSTLELLLHTALTSTHISTSTDALIRVIS